MLLLTERNCTLNKRNYFKKIYHYNNLCFKTSTIHTIKYYPKEKYVQIKKDKLHFNSKSVSMH